MLLFPLAILNGLVYFLLSKLLLLQSLHEPLSILSPNESRFGVAYVNNPPSSASHATIFLLCLTIDVLAFILLYKASNRRLPRAGATV